MLYQYFVHLIQNTYCLNLLLYLLNFYLNFFDSISTLFCYFIPLVLIIIVPMKNGFKNFNKQPNPPISIKSTIQSDYDKIIYNNNSSSCISPKKSPTSGYSNIIIFIF